MGSKTFARRPSVLDSTFTTPNTPTRFGQRSRLVEDFFHHGRHLEHRLIIVLAVEDGSRHSAPIPLWQGPAGTWPNLAKPGPERDGIRSRSLSPKSDCDERLGLRSGGRMPQSVSPRIPDWLATSRRYGRLLRRRGAG